MNNRLANITRGAFISELEKRYGAIRKLGRGRSLFEIGQGAVRVFVRYSKIHSRDKLLLWYGIGVRDLEEMEGYQSFICFIWEEYDLPLILPFDEYKEILYAASPASDDQYKIVVYLDGDKANLYVPRTDQVNIEARLGWSELDAAVESSSRNK